MNGDLDVYQNSSDLEFEPPPSKTSGRDPGQASIAQIIQNASNDRLTTKRTVKQLQFGCGAPGTRVQQELWVNRFNAFQEFTLKKPLTEPFNGDDLLRFFDSVTGKLQPGSRGKPGPNIQVVVRGFHILSDYGTFTYPS